MPINEWWAGDPSERFWLEITDRERLGQDLHAPKSDKSGRETPGYSLVKYVRDGDIVFHYWKQAGEEKAIVGFSQATGSLQTTTIRWQSHGTYGRGSGDLGHRPAWRFPLANFTDLDRPVTLERLRELAPDLKRLADVLAEKHGASESLYLPFAFSSKRPLRISQAYLAKLPASFVSGIPGLQQAMAIPLARHADAPPFAQRPQARGTGYQSDPKVRKALERHALELALRYFRQIGYDVQDVGDSNPFDVLATNTKAELHVEVKGSAGVSTTVELTAGEVNEASTAKDVTSVLFVVDQISWTRSASGDVQTHGGRTRIWWNWSPEPGRLTPTSFRYLLPPGSEQPN